ncbi:uncharacterized protein TNCV_4258661 [Trichonephila clavipes]|nr:uncharacterized protein TNCV_4258661 [Trichonephila clavipes]
MGSQLGHFFPANLAAHVKSNQCEKSEQRTGNVNKSEIEKLKTFGRILPKKWNKWAESILYYDKATGSNEIRTDDPETKDESAQIEPDIAKKRSQSEVISKDGEDQTEENSDLLSKR